MPDAALEIVAPISTKQRSKHLNPNVADPVELVVVTADLIPLFQPHAKMQEAVNECSNRKDFL